MLVQAAALAGLGATPAAAQVPVGPYTLFHWSVNNHWYALTSTQQLFAGAEAEANSAASLVSASFGTPYRGYLASVTSAAEDAFLAATFTAPDLWIGLFQPPGTPEPTDGFEWTSGESLAYTNFCLGEPNNYQGLEQDHVVTNFAFCAGGGHGWDDRDGTITYHYGIMEFEPVQSVVPEPMSMALLGTGLAGLGALRRRKKSPIA